MFRILDGLANTLSQSEALLHPCHVRILITCSTPSHHYLLLAALEGASVPGFDPNTLLLTISSTPSDCCYYLQHAKELLYEALFTALVHDKVDFVQLFLDSGVELKKFLTCKRLRDLYDDVSSGGRVGKE